MSYEIGILQFAIDYPKQTGRFALQILLEMNFCLVCRLFNIICSSQIDVELIIILISVNLSRAKTFA